MEVTREQIAQGVVKFINSNVINHVDDKATKLLLGMAAAAVEIKPQIIDSVLDNPMLSLFIKTENGYDLSAIEKAAASAMDKYGNLTIYIPPIPFISPSEKTLTFNADDVRKLRASVEGRA